MNQEQWEKLTSKKQVKLLRENHFYKEAATLKEIYENVKKIKIEISLLKRFLFTKNSLLRAEVAMLAEYEKLNKTEREFIKEKPFKYIKRHSKIIALLKEDISVYQKLRVERRASLKEQNENLTSHIDYAWEIFCDGRPSQMELMYQINILRKKILDEQGKSIEDLKNDPEHQKIMIVYKQCGYR